MLRRKRINKKRYIITINENVVNAVWNTKKAAVIVYNYLKKGLSHGQAIELQEATYDFYEGESVRYWPSLKTLRKEVIK